MYIKVSRGDHILLLSVPGFRQQRSSVVLVDVFFLNSDFPGWSTLFDSDFGKENIHVYDDYVCHHHLRTCIVIIRHP